ncbi:short-chain alcohol dehydrogenases/reductase [Fusarium denticulatum]|uniref:Short-chain alcohol dehydrogenases/reductase n=1 Tax=Fusarium denticulatum TaxID=48507 RepID=A0A8H5UGV4_9HYPO|nr:short-chain alcohol dehydrogenases/reductase [Fusarium denticulatum]
MTGTIIITGANGSLALAYISYLLKTHPSYTILATVRNASLSDPNTAQLSSLPSSHPKLSIEALDLSLLSNVRTFSESTAKRVASGEIPPIKAIICNAFTMSVTEQVYTPDGFERTFQVNHLSHFVLVLKLIGSMASDGRIVMLGSDTHYTTRSHPLFRQRPGIPEDTEILVKPLPDKKGKEYDGGFHRYGNSKLANIMFMHDLNAKLEKNPKLSGITAIAMDPGGMVDSRAHRIQTPFMRFAFSIVLISLPILRHFTDTMRPAAQSGRELVELSVGEKFVGAKGYFMGARREEEDIACKDVHKRELLWNACWKWAGMMEEETVLL